MKPFHQLLRAFACLLFILTATHQANAAPTFRFTWETRVLDENKYTSSGVYEPSYATSHWNGVALPTEGYGHFRANGTSLPTRTVPGSFRFVPFKWPNYGTIVQVPFNRFQADLAAPLGILRVGANTLSFDYGPLPPTFQYDLMTVSAPSIGTDRLFRVSFSRDGGSSILYHWVGNDDGSPNASGQVDADAFPDLNLATSRTYTLTQLNPELEQAIKNFQEALAKDQDALVAGAASVTNLANQLARLDELATKVAALMKDGLSEDLAAALADLLAKYPELPKATRDALVDMVTTVEKSVAEMQAELDKITSDFRKQTADVVGLVEKPTKASGFDYDDLTNFGTTIDPTTIPGVTVPDTSGALPFDASHDPYAKYADQILAKLAPFVSSDDVIDRIDFLSVVRGWRDNQTALESALRARGFPLAETNAFNDARNRVTAYLRKYLDGQEWFLASPVPPETKAAIDGIMATRYAALATALKDAMNLWRNKVATPDQALAIETATGLANGSAGIDSSTDSDTVSHFVSSVRGVIAGITAGVRVGVGFAPVVGDAMDVCEAITGYEFCTSTARKLDFTDRVLSGLGAIVGSGRFWRFVGHGISTGSAAIIARIASVADHLDDLTLAERRLLLKRIGHTVAHLDDLGGKEIVRLTDKLGELTMMQLGPVLKGKGLQDLEALKILTARMDPSVLAKAAANGAAVKSLPPLAGKSAVDLRKTFTAAGFTLNAGTTPVQEVWTHADGSVIRMAITGTSYRPWPHLKREIAKSPHAFRLSDIVCKVTDAGVVVPIDAAGTKGAKALLTQWFRDTVGRMPDLSDATTSEIGLMTKVWGDATHILYTP